jgi:D-arabinan endo alpha-(1,5)-arabinofuranosidase
VRRTAVIGAVLALSILGTGVAAQAMEGPSKALNTASAAVTPVCPGPPPTGPAVSQATLIQQVTGSLSSPMSGADLGVAWSDGVSVMHVFGDNGTSVKPQFSGPILTNWTPNAIGLDRSGDLSKGITYGTPGIVRPILPLFSASEDGLVPTGGIHVNGKDYVKYVVFVKGHNDQTQTRANGIAESTDGGLTWHRVYSAIWQQNAGLTDNFQQQAMAEGPDGYVYVFSTESGRLSNVDLMRVPNASILDKTAYRYWTGTAWSATQSSAKPIFTGPAGEMSAQYLPSVGRWVAMYNNDSGNPSGATLLRYASSPTGPWSAPQVALPDSVRTVYAPMIDPRSTGSDLYFYGSDWSTYQTYLFTAKLNLP